MMFLVTRKEEGYTSQEEVSTEIMKVLENFKDVMSLELPKKLPPR